MSTGKKKKGCLVYLLVLVIVMVSGTILMLVSGLIQDHKKEKAEAARQEQLAIEQAEREAYDAQMSVLRTPGYVCADTADKAVTLYVDPEDDTTNNLFSERFLPESLLPESAADVRYLVSVTYRYNKVNEYFGGGNAYRRFYDVQVTDLLTGNLLVENTFAGSEPPMSIPMESESGWGGYPKDNEIAEWLPGAIEEAVLNYETESAKQAYSEAMQVLGQSGYRCDSSAGKAVAVRTEYNEGDPLTIYCTEYIPEALLAETPEEVRYLVRYKCILNTVGYYAITPARQRELEFEIIDLTDGSVVDENTFLGAEPPETIRSKEEAIGPMPDSAEIIAWIEDVLC